MVASMVVLYVKCPQAGNDPTNFTAPLVPFIPTICIWVNFYFVSQISDLGLGLGCGWVGLAILSYLLYGFKHAAGRNGWHDLMRYQLDDTNFAKNPSMSEVRPSMNSLLKE
uniref:Cationic amino acid transporter C-terminal domain-containing protein n=1 Tax=Globisporangium ultimum (strain ATCC 200006 / CBS 805.95 / DAOM BR144) TaxID=431595 RepID=K3WEC7_GLOUD